MSVCLKPARDIDVSLAEYNSMVASQSESDNFIQVRSLENNKESFNFNFTSIFSILRYSPFPRLRVEKQIKNGRHVSVFGDAFVFVHLHNM